MSMTFYYAPMSTAVLSQWAIEELGVPVEKVLVDLKAGESRKDPYLALNPNGKVPLLVVDGTPIFETLAIINYLGETYGVEKGMYPAPGLKRAEAMKWMAWASVSVGEALSRFQATSSERVPKEQHNAAAAASGKAEVERLLGILDADFAKKKRPYLLGDTFTLADVHVGGWIGYVAMCGFDLAKYPALATWAKTIQSRPIFGKLMGGGN